MNVDFKRKTDVISSITLIRVFQSHHCTVCCGFFNDVINKGVWLKTIHFVVLSRLRCLKNPGSCDTWGFNSWPSSLQSFFLSLVVYH